MVAPDGNRSAIGRGITTRRALAVERIAFGDGTFGYATDGTPVDCVRLAGLGLIEGWTPELVVSGINHGSNLGDDVTYSGTVAAAMEGLLLGLPAIAVSQQSESREMDFRLGVDFVFDVAARFVARLVEELEEVPLPPSTLLNVNVPGGRAARRRGRAAGQADLPRPAARAGGRWGRPARRTYFIYGTEPGYEDEPGTDLVAVASGHVAVTPVHLDLTHHDGIGPLSTADLARLLAPAAAGGRVTLDTAAGCCEGGGPHQRAEGLSMPARPLRTSRWAPVAVALFCTIILLPILAPPAGAATAKKRCKAGQVALRYVAARHKKPTLLCVRKVAVGRTPAAAAVAVERMVGAGKLLPKSSRKLLSRFPRKLERAFARAREAQVRQGATAKAAASRPGDPVTTSTSSVIAPAADQAGEGTAGSTSTTQTTEGAERSTVRYTHSSTSRHTVFGPKCPDYDGNVVTKLVDVDTDIHAIEQRGKRTIVETEYRDTATVTGGFNDDMALRAPLHLEVELVVVTRTRVEIAATHKVISSSSSDPQRVGLQTEIGESVLKDPAGSLQDPLKVVMDMTLSGGGAVKLEDFAADGGSFFLLMVGTTWFTEIGAMNGFVATLKNMVEFACVSAEAVPSALTLGKGKSGDVTVTVRGLDDHRPLPSNAQDQVRSGDVTIAPLADRDIRGPATGTVFHVTNVGGGKGEVTVGMVSRRGSAPTVAVPITPPGCGASTRAAMLRQAVSCTGKLAGTFSATADLRAGPGGIPVDVTMSGSVVLKPIPSPFPAFPGVVAPTYYGVESGSFHYHASGTLPGGCQLLADGPVDLLFDATNQRANVLTLTAGPPATYTIALAPPMSAMVPGTIAQCPNPDEDHAITWGVSAGVPALIWSPAELALGPNGEAAGTNAGVATGGAAQQTWVWDLQPQ